MWVAGPASAALGTVSRRSSIALQRRGASGASSVCGPPTRPVASRMANASATMPPAISAMPFVSWLPELISTPLKAQITSIPSAIVNVSPAMM